MTVIHIAMIMIDGGVFSRILSGTEWENIRTNSFFLGHLKQIAIMW